MSMKGCEVNLESNTTEGKMFDHVAFPDLFSAGI